MLMSRIIFLPYSARGHVSPMLPVLGELHSRGERVVLVAGAQFAAAAALAGAEFVVAAAHQVRVPARAGAVRERAQLWLQRRKAWQDTATVCAALMRDEPGAMWVIDPHVSWALPLAARHGVRAVPFWVTQARPHRSGIVNLLPEMQYGSGCFGSSYCFAGPLLGKFPAPAPVLPPATTGPLLVVAPGTVFARSPGYFHSVIAAFAQSDWTLVLATAQLPVAGLGKLPPNVFAYQFIPQLDVLAGATAFLTHGGINSVHEAIVSGVPMLVSPRSREQRRNVTALARLGVAELARPGELRAQAERVASSRSVRNRCVELRDRAVQRNGGRLAADWLVSRK